MENKNFILKFFDDLINQINQIESPKLGGFVKQIITVTCITLFFSTFFFCISFVWIKVMVFIFGVGS